MVFSGAKQRRSSAASLLCTKSPRSTLESHATTSRSATYSCFFKVFEDDEVDACNIICVNKVMYVLQIEFWAFKVHFEGSFMQVSTKVANLEKNLGFNDCDDDDDDALVDVISLSFTTFPSSAIDMFKKDDDDDI